MSFISLDYLFVYLPVVVGLYLIFRKTFLANVIIMVASYIFYAAAAVWYPVPLIITLVIDFVVGLMLSREKRPNYRRLLLISSLVANLGLLGFFKYPPGLISGAHLGL